jgi:phosphotransferase system  glucose/maltose/N-acetylglucosamine-specific IIC component
VLRNLDLNQRKALSQFFNAIAATWFSGGIISPLFIQPSDPIDAVFLIVLSEIFTIICLVVAVSLVKEKRK